MFGRRALWGFSSSALAFAIAVALVPALVAAGLRPQPSLAAFAAAIGYAGPPRRARPILVAVALAVAGVRYWLGLEAIEAVVLDAALGALCGVVAGFLVGLVRTRLPWRAFVVPHTHWDREWYETVRGYRPSLLACVDGVVAELERAGGVDRFTFDGQTIALEDYLEDRPQMRERVDALIRSGRLAVGPWYVLSDLILVHGESTLRNLEEGLRVAGAHGRAMRVGYVADPFGHPAQMPQILRGFGYRSYVFARGVGDEGEDLGAEFEWQAPSGDRVLAYHLVGHYDNALALLRDWHTVERADPDLSRRIRRHLPEVLARATAYANSDVVLLMVGTDHTPITPELVEGLRTMHELSPRLRTRVATLEEAIEGLALIRMGTHAREMIAGRYRPILRGVNSTRMWIKQENAELERLLLRWLEPFAALIGRTGREPLRPLWRTLLQCHPHDSICGCSIDEVHDVDMRLRFAAVREEGEALRRELLGAANGATLVWSSLPFPAGRVVERLGARVFVRFGGLGAARLAGDAPEAPVRAEADGVLDNGRLHVEVGTDGSFTVRGPGGTSGPHNVLVDEGDRGDEYTYSFAGPSVSSRAVAGTRVTSCDGLRGEVRVRYVLRVPAALRPDRRARDERTVELPIETVVSLEAEGEHVEVRTTFDNTARDHRLRALFATGRATAFHTAAEQFAWIRRRNVLPRPRGWREPPTDTAHMQDFVAVADPAGGIAVAGDGLAEYGILAGGREIALTLVRSVGYLSRGDLPERPEQAGPQVETPGAQVQGRREARYCLVPLASDRELARIARIARAFREPPFVAGAGEARALLTLEQDGPIELSALRPGAVSGTVVLRLVNPSAQPATAHLRLPGALGARATDLREGEEDLGANGLPVLRTAAPLELAADGVLVARLAPFEIGTWVIRMSSG